MNTLKDLESCFLWKDEILYPLLASHTIIAITCFIVSFMIVYLIKKRPDIPLVNQFRLFSIFVALCGLSHLLSMLDMWLSWYYISTGVHMVAAFVSVLIAVAFWPAVKIALSLPSPKKLIEINAKLGIEVTEKIKLTAERDYLISLLEEHGIEYNTDS